MTEPETDIIALPTALVVRRVHPDDSIETVSEKVMVLERLGEWVKAARESVEASLIEHIKEHGPVKIGELLYWVGKEKKDPKCVDLVLACEAVFETVGGDLSAFYQHLSKNALKPGACRQTLGEKFGLHFKVEEPEELQSDEAGKAIKKLQKANPMFMR